MFVSEEVEIFSGDYLNNPFGCKKDKRIDDWLSILNKLPLIQEVNVNLPRIISSTSRFIKTSRILDDDENDDSDNDL